MLIILSLLAHMPGCIPGVGRMIARPLTDEDMAIPAVRYQTVVDMFQRGQVRLPSPATEPEILWTRILQQGVNVFVDSEGCSWFSDYDSHKQFNRIIRLNPDGTISWQRVLRPWSGATVSMAEAAVVLENAVVCIVTFDFPVHGSGETDDTAEQDKLDNSARPISTGFRRSCYGGCCCGSSRYRISTQRQNLSELVDEHMETYDELTYYDFANMTGAYLQCMDNDGNTLWRTETVTTASDSNTWRLPGNRLAIKTGDRSYSLFTNEESFLIFSLENGELTESIPYPGYSTIFPAGLPLITDDGDFITYEDSCEGNKAFVARLAPDGTEKWHVDFSDGLDGSCPSISENGLLFYGRSGGLSAIDCETGEIKWSRNNGFIHRPLGINHNGDLLCTSYHARVDADRNYIISSQKLLLIDQDGDVIWSINLPSPMEEGESHVIIYEDNSILIGYSSGFSLLNPNGTVRWTVDIRELGLTRARHLMQWNFSPGPDGVLVVSVLEDTGEKRDQFHIFGLGPG